LGCTATTSALLLLLLLLLLLVLLLLLLLLWSRYLIVDGGAWFSSSTALLHQPNMYDTSKSFIHGCSEGSAFTQWQVGLAHAADTSRGVLEWYAGAGDDGAGDDGAGGYEPAHPPPA
jgi:hypothetical protein